MNNFIKYFFQLWLSGLLVSFVSCTTQQLITINPDGTARIVTSEDQPGQFEIFYKSELITKKAYGPKDSGIAFTISNVDSLGNYLSPLFNKDYFQFRLNGDSLLIRDGQGNAFVQQMAGCCNSYIEIILNKKIKNISTKNNFVKQKENKIFIRKPKRYFGKVEKQTNLVIVLSN